MSDIEKTQKAFTDYLLEGDEVLEDSLKAPQEGSLRERMAVYGNGYFERLSEILDDYFPVLKSFMGERRFDSLITLYLENHRSHSFTVRTLGDKLADFIAEYYPLEPHLSELASIECLIEYAFDAPNANVLTLEDIQAIEEDNWPQLCFQFHPSVKFTFLKHNMLEVYDAIKEEEDIPLVQALDEPVAFMVWRHGEVVHYLELDETQTRLAEGISGGLNFEKLCTSLESFINEEEIPQVVANQIIEWIHEEVFTESNKETPPTSQT